MAKTKDRLRVRKLVKAGGSTVMALPGPVCEVARAEPGQLVQIWSPGEGMIVAEIMPRLAQEAPWQSNLGRLMGCVDETRGRIRAAGGAVMDPQGNRCGVCGEEQVGYRYECLHLCLCDERMIAVMIMLMKSKIFTGKGSDLL